VKGKNQNGKETSRTLEDSTYYDLTSWTMMLQPRLMTAMTESHIFYGDSLANSPSQDLSGPLEVYELYVCLRQPSIDGTPGCTYFEILAFILPMAFIEAAFK
jgi:hypothetical protein